MGYASVKSDRQHESDAARIKELEAQLKKERELNAWNQSSTKVDEDTPAGHVVVEKTSKRLKLRLLVSYAMMLFGLFVGVASSMARADNGMTTSIVLILISMLFPIGVVTWIITKIQIWWRHG